MTYAISQPFRFDNFGKVATTVARYEAVADRIRVLISTRRGDRVMRPTVGSQAADIVFSNVSPATVGGLEQALQQEITASEGDVSITNVSVNSRSEGSTLFLDVTYAINERQQRLVYTATIEVGGQVQEIVNRA